MITIDTWATMARTLLLPLDANLKRLLRVRRNQISNGDDLATIARFIVTEPNDTLASIEAMVGFPLIGEEGAPAWEWIERHPSGVIEAAFVFTDDGPTDVLLVSNIPANDAELIELLQRHTAEGIDHQGTSLP